MTTDEIYQRLARIAVDLERIAADSWQLEQERARLRTDLRRALSALSGETEAPVRPPAPPAEPPATYHAIQGQVLREAPLPPAQMPRRTVF
jgi:hypothetical protein